MNNNINKSILGVVGEYYVAAELGRRGMYAQLTLGNQKRTDLLVFSENEKLLRIEVKSKQGPTWPNCKGISDQNSIIIFIDFNNISEFERPKFYILNEFDWTNLVRQKQSDYSKKWPHRKTKIENNVLIFLEQTSKSGKPYKGCSVKPSDITNFYEKWEKIEI